MFSFIIKFIMMGFLLFILVTKKSLCKTINLYDCTDCVEINLNDTNEYWSTHNSYIGQSILSVDIKKELLKIGSIYASYDNNRGTTVTNNYIGSFNTISSIENKKTNKLYELYYYNTFKNLYFKIGKFDLQNNFGSDDQFSYFVNTSSTSSSIFSNNTYEMSNYGPVSSLGIYLEYNLNDNFKFKGSIVSDNPFKINTDLTDTKTDMHGNMFKIESPMFLFETNMYFGKKYKTYISLGGFYDTGKQSITYSNIIHRNNAAFYISVEHDLINKNDNSLQLLVRYMRDPYSDRSTITSTFDTGLLYSNKKHIIGILFGYELGDKNMFTNLKSKIEYRLELTYRYNVTDNFYIQPDIQYIDNIAGYNHSMFLFGIRESFNY